MARMIDFSLLRKRLMALIAKARAARMEPNEIERTFRIMWAPEADAEHWIEFSHDRFLGRSDAGSAEVEPLPPGIYKIFREDPSELDEEDGELPPPTTDPVAVGILLADDAGAAIGAATAGSGDPNAMGQFQRSVSRLLEDARHENGRMAVRLKEQEERADRYYRETNELEDELRAERKKIRRLEAQIEELEDELDDAEDTEDALAESAAALLKKYGPRFLRRFGIDIDPEDIDRADARDEIWDVVKADADLIKRLRERGAGAQLKRLGVGDDPSPPPASPEAP